MNMELKVRAFKTSYVSVHPIALLDGKCLDLSQTGVHENCVQYNWEHSNQDFCFFNLFDSAKFPGFSSLLQHGPKTYKDMMHFFSYESMINSGIYQMILMIILELTSSLKNLSLCSFFIMNFVQHSCCIWDGKIPVSNGRNKYLFKQVVN